MAIRNITPKLKVSPSTMSKILDKEKELIRTDSLNGLGQDGKRFGSYRSRDYAKYKLNFMNRFTTTKGEKVQGAKGTKLKSLRGQAVVSNQVGFVNMTLTGQMANGLHQTYVKENEGELSYLPKDAGKIIGNKALDREVVGLNDKNQNIVRDMVIEDLNKGIDKWAGEGEIVINIGRG